MSEGNGVGWSVAEPLYIACRLQFIYLIFSSSLFIYLSITIDYYCNIVFNCFVRPIKLVIICCI